MANPSPFEFFEAFYPGITLAGRLPLYTTTLEGAQRSYWCFNLLEADRRCSKYRNKRQVLFGTALHNADVALAIAKTRRGTAVHGTIRGCEASVTALPALWAEIPYGNSAAKSGGAPSILPDLRQAFDLLKAITQRASIVISGGGKLRAFWLLDRPWVFDLEDQQATDKAAAKALLRRIWWAIACLAAERGWNLDAAAGQAGTLAAAFHIPYSPTGTGANGPRTVLESFPLAPGDKRYQRRDFESLPEPPAKAARPWQEVLEPPACLAPAPQIFPLRPIARGCGWLGHCRTDRATLDKKELLLATKLLRLCDAPGADGAKLIHILYSGHPGYDAFDVDKKIAAAMRAPGGPITCRQIGKTAGVAQRYCAVCPHFGLIATPVELALEDGARGNPGGDAEHDNSTPQDRAPMAATDTTEADTPAAGKPHILITTRQHEVNDQALAALAAAGVLYECAGTLVEVVRSPGAAPAVRRVVAPRLRELLSRHCAFVTERRGELLAAYPPRWTTDALMARGSWPELPGLEKEPAGDATVEIPDPGVECAAQTAEMLAGLEALLASLGGAATARQITGALAAEPERSPQLAAALPCLIPDFDPGEPGAPAALGFCLRGLKGRVFGGRALVEMRRIRDGIAWAVRPASPVAPPVNDRKEEATA